MSIRDAVEDASSSKGVRRAIEAHLWTYCYYLLVYSVY